MASKLYVIVHGDYLPVTVNGTADCRKEIARIKNEEAFLEVSGDAGQVHPDMPSPSDDLEVLVCGGIRNACCSAQLRALQAKGYNADYHDPACYNYIFGMPFRPLT